MSDIDLTEAVEAFKGAWERADAEGSAGHRVEAGLEAALPAIREQLAQQIETRQWTVESTHHVHGVTCICGFRSPVSRQRTEHITHELGAARIVRGES